MHTYGAQMHLHSSMERLKVRTVAQFGCLVWYLHSSMERLKGATADLQSYTNNIYIPVWRD